MKPDQIRSIRLNHLLKMALGGCSLHELKEKCDTWGVTESTKKSYINTVTKRIEIMRR